MKYLMFAIYDSKAEAYMRPWMMQTEALAVRAFADMANDPEHNIGQHPEDYHLVEVGTWSENKGIILGLDAPRTVITGTTCTQKGKPN